MSEREPTEPVRLPESTKASWLVILRNIVVTVLLVYFLITAVGMVGSGFKWASGGSSAAKGIFAFAVNPIAGLILGILATALVQSSSTVTSVIVGLVATGQVPVSMAVPMVMGANIGTTVTNTLVSIGHITRPQEFRRAFAAATVHDIFNFLAVIIFLPIEIITRQIFGTGLLEMITSPISQALMGGGQAAMETNIKDFNIIKSATKPVINFFYHAGKGDNPDTGILAGLGRPWGGVVMIVIAISMIFGTIWALGRFLRSNLTGRAERIFHAAVGRGPISGIASGTVVTVMVQSSSTTTSLIVPMAGAGMMRLEQVFPFTLGANIGTCITALLVSLAASKDPEAGLHIALVHLAFNLAGTLVIYGIPFLRRIPLAGARWLADLTLKNRGLAIGYILVLYFAVPLLVLGLMQLISPAPKSGDPAEEESLPTEAAVEAPAEAVQMEPNATEAEAQLDSGSEPATPAE